MQLKMFAILNRCIIIGNDDEKTVLDGAALIITDTNLYITMNKYGWLMDKLDQSIEVAESQLMMDLVAVENNDDDDKMFTIRFDDDHERKEDWECSFETDTCLKDTFAAIAQSWEKLFEVPLMN